MLDYELDAFGKRLGLPALALNENGLAVIAMDGIGTLTLQKGEGGAEDMLLVALASPVDPTESAARYRAALERSNWRTALPHPLSVALFRDMLIRTVRLPEAAVTAAGLENVLRFLMDESAQ